jgi:hypothetical protein
MISRSFHSLTLTKLPARSYLYDLPSSRIVMSIFRAADALDFDKFRAFAISYLEHTWPNRLEGTSYDTDYAADTLLLARRYNINSIRKRALYELVKSEGFEQGIDEDMEDGENQSAVLSASDVSLLLRTREKLTAFWMRKAIPPPQPTCKSPINTPACRTCAVTKHRAHELYKEIAHDSKVFEDYMYDPIEGVKILCSAPWIEGEVWPGSTPEGLVRTTAQAGYLCFACAKAWRAIWQAERTKLWNDMDDWFELCNEEEENGEE